MNHTTLTRQYCLSCFNPGACPVSGVEVGQRIDEAPQAPAEAVNLPREQDCEPPPVSIDRKTVQGRPGLLRAGHPSPTYSPLTVHTRRVPYSRSSANCTSGFWPFSVETRAYKATRMRELPRGYGRPQNGDVFVT